MATLPPPVGGMLFGEGGGDASAPVEVGLGKSSRQQNLGSAHGGIKSTLAGGDPYSRGTGNYGKGASRAKSFGGLSQIRGGTGVMRRTQTRGGLGGKVGSSKPEYSKTGD